MKIICRSYNQIEKGWIAFKILAGKSTGNRPLGRPKRRWEDTIGMGLKEIGITTRNLLDWAQDRDYWKSLRMRH